MANEFVVKNGLIVSGSANVQNSVIAQSFTGSLSGSIAAPGSDTQLLLNNGGIIGATSTLVVSSSRVGLGTPYPSASLHISSSSETLLRVESPISSSILTVSISGSVGIGTSSPRSTFHILQKDDNTLPDLPVDQLFLINSSGSYFVDSSGSFLTATNPEYSPNAAFVVDVLPFHRNVLYVSGSRVGVNTGAPSTEFQVSGSIDSHNLYLTQQDSRVGIGANDPLSSLHIRYNGSPYQDIPSGYDFLVDENGDYILTGTGTPLLVLDPQSYTGSLLKIDSLPDYNNILYVSGNLVGINTGAPNANLDVNGTTSLSGSLSISGSTLFRGDTIQTGSASLTGSLNVQGPIFNNGVNIQALSIAYAIALG